MEREEAPASSRLPASGHELDIRKKGRRMSINSSQTDGRAGDLGTYVPRNRKLANRERGELLEETNGHV